MTQEERKLKREQDTKRSIAVLTGLACIVIAVVAAVVLLISFLMKDKDKPIINIQKNTETQNETDAGSTEETEKPVIDPLTQEAITIVTGMTTEQKVAQMFVITPDSLTGTAGATVVGNTTKQAYAKYPVGGLVYEKNNFKTAEQTQAMLEAMKTLSVETVGLPIFLGVEEEGGKASVIASNSPLDVDNIDNMSVIGATGDAAKAYEASAAIGTYMSGLGFNLNFAPMADVLTNEANTALTDRSFGTDSAIVADMTVSALQGLKEKGVYGVVKHFPGQGATIGDSRKGAVSTDKTLEELMACELVPFQKAIESGAEFIMVGHISVPGITGNTLPSSLSDYMITQVLRTEMGYKGIVITDAMNVKAITDSYNSGDAAVAAIQAGADMVFMPADFEMAYNAVLEAVKNGTISEEKINSSMVRIVKIKLGM